MIASLTVFQPVDSTPSLGPDEASYLTGSKVGIDTKPGGASNLGATVDSDSGPGTLYSIGWNYGARHVVTDFNAKKDTIDLSAFWISYDSVKIYNDGFGNVVIDLMDLNRQRVIIKNTTVDLLNAENIKGFIGDFCSAVAEDSLELDLGRRFPPSLLINDNYLQG